MRGTSCADLTVDTAQWNTLPPDARVLLEQAEGIFSDAEWWPVVLTHAVPSQAQAIFAIIRAAGRIAALVPVLRSAGRIGGLTTPYTCEYTPLFAAGLDQASRIAAMDAFARFAGGAGVVRLDAIPAEWDGLVSLEAAARRAGLVPLRFDHFGNWSEDVTGLDWPNYLGARPGALRETIRRRVRRAEKQTDARFDVFTRPAEMDVAAAAFESVYDRSWKDAEPFPAFNVGLMRAMAACGRLRLGVWSLESQPVAVQLWVVKNGHATVLKLAHDEAFKAHSPGTVLTALMLRHLLDVERVTRIDFGRGDDGYKRGWASERRQRIGILLVSPWRLAGAAALLRHAAGRLRSVTRGLTKSTSDDLMADG